ncbi:MAG: hypothetical protein Q4F00_08920, partial [bacterium]|nr:hypothetical protein [bacterium]
LCAKIFCNFMQKGLAKNNERLIYLYVYHIHSLVCCNVQREFAYFFLNYSLSLSVVSNQAALVDHSPILARCQGQYCP